MSPRLLLATRSRDKVRELAGILLPWSRLQILSLSDAGVEPDAEEETVEAFDSFLENAFAKAEYFHRRTGIPALADDSGLVVDALDGAPGVRSKRFCDRHDLAGMELDRANNALLLDKLAGGAEAERTARYVCVAAFVDGTVRAAATGTLRGRIGLEPRGSGGFGYDPLFVLEDGRTVAELDSNEKNAISHRGRAFRALAPRLAALLAHVDRGTGRG